MRGQIYGPGSGHNIRCRFCGYSGNSYYHMSCVGGVCTICGHPHARRVCQQCDKITCEDHLETHPVGDMRLCPKCMAAHRNQPYEAPEPAPQCDCNRCNHKRHSEERIIKLERGEKVEGGPRGMTEQVAVAMGEHKRKPGLPQCHTCGKPMGSVHACYGKQEKPESRSVQRRKASQRGEEAPTFEDGGIR